MSSQDTTTTSAKKADKPSTSKGASKAKSTTTTRKRRDPSVTVSEAITRMPVGRLSALATNLVSSDVETAELLRDKLTKALDEGDSEAAADEPSR